MSMLSKRKKKRNEEIHRLNQRMKKVIEGEFSRDPPMRGDRHVGQRTKEDLAYPTINRTTDEKASTVLIEYQTNDTRSLADTRSWPSLWCQGHQMNEDLVFLSFRETSSRASSNERHLFRA